MRFGTVSAISREARASARFGFGHSKIILAARIPIHWLSRKPGQQSRISLGPGTKDGDIAFYIDTIAISLQLFWVKFEWDERKETANIAKPKHGVSFAKAQSVFADRKLVIAADEAHSKSEPRLFCVGRSEAGGILTVRFTFRRGIIRIIGAGYWRKGKTVYEKENQIRR